MKKLLLFILLLAAVPAMAQSLCTVSGVVEKSVNNQPANGRITIVKVVKSGVLISSDPVYVPIAVDGSFSFTVRQGAVMYVFAPIIGLKKADGVALPVPNQASVLLKDLVPIETPTTEVAFPAQTGNTGKYLTTNGTNLSWGTVAGSATWGAITGTLSNQTDLQAALDAKAVAVHTHAISDVTGLTAALAGKSDTSHTHTFSSLTSKPTTLSGYGITDAYPLSGNPSNFLTANQTITLSGDVSGSGTTSITTTISNLAVSKLAALTASRVLVSDASGIISPSSVTSTTLAFLDATSSIQTQLNGKAATSHTHGYADLTAFPSQTGNSGKYLTTNGSALSWGQDISSTGTPQFARIGIGAAADGSIPYYQSHTSTTAQGWKMVYPTAGNIARVFEITNAAGTGGMYLGGFQGFYEGQITLTAPSAQGSGTGVIFNHGANTGSFQFAGTSLTFTAPTNGSIYLLSGSSGYHFQGSARTDIAALTDAGAFSVTGGLDVAKTATSGKVTATATAGATYTADCSTANSFRITFGAGNITSLTASNIPGSSTRTATIYFTLIQDGTGSRTAAWNTSIFKFSGGLLPQLSTGAGKIDKFAFECNGSICELVSGVLDVR